MAYLGRRQAFKPLIQPVRFFSAPVVPTYVYTQYPDRIHDVKRQQYLYPSTTGMPAVIILNPTVSSDMWAAATNAPYPDKTFVVSY